MKKFLQITALVSCFGVVSQVQAFIGFAAAYEAKENGATAPQSTPATMTLSFTNSTQAIANLMFYAAPSAGSTTGALLSGTSTITTTPSSTIQVGPGTTSNVIVTGTPASFTVAAQNAKSGQTGTAVTTTINGNTAFTITGKGTRNGNMTFGLTVTATPAA